MPPYFGSHCLNCNSYSIRVFPLIFVNIVDVKSYVKVVLIVISLLEEIKSLPYVLILFLI